jgi:hypothetical protein
MFPAMLFAIAIVALAQFALYYWRAVLSGVASQPLSSRVLEAAHVEESGLRGGDFGKLADLLDLTPELKSSHSGLGFVRSYYHIVDKAGVFFGRISPGFNNWSEQERVLCTRFAAVQIERRLQATLAQAASIHSC